MARLDQFHRLERRLTRRIASWDSPWARQALPAVETAAEGTKIWWGMAVLMAVAGGHRKRTAAVGGVASMLAAEVVSNAVCKQLSERPRPPARLTPHDDPEERPNSSSFPSGHTAAAVGFTAAVAPTAPWLGAAAAVPATMVALERIHSGAHYPSDVVAGAALGLSSAWLIRRTPRILLHHVL